MTESEGKELLRKVGLDIEVDLQVGMKGGMLSGGQKQRVAIARAIAKDPKVLLLDEATSALDKETEQQVQDEIYELFKDKTVVVIAHRLSTIKNADTICVVNEGKVRETGTHEELMMREHGLYFSLANTMA